MQPQYMDVSRLQSTQHPPQFLRTTAVPTYQSNQSVVSNVIPYSSRINTYNSHVNRAYHNSRTEIHDTYEEVDSMVYCPTCQTSYLSSRTMEHAARHSRAMDGVLMNLTKK